MHHRVHPLLKYFHTYARAPSFRQRESRIKRKGKERKERKGRKGKEGKERKERKGRKGSQKKKNETRRSCGVDSALRERAVCTIGGCVRERGDGYRERRGVMGWGPSEARFLAESTPIPPPLDQSTALRSGSRKKEKEEGASTGTGCDVIGEGMAEKGE